MSDFSAVEHPHAFSSSTAHVELKPVRCAARDGRKWLVQGFLDFTRNPGNWLIAMVFYLLFAGLLLLVPVAGWLAIVVMTPVFLGGLMFGCHQLWLEHNFHSRYLFAGFETNAKQLLLLGVWHALMVLITVSLALAILLIVGDIDFRAVFRASTAEQVRRELLGDPLSVIACFTALLTFALGTCLATCGLWMSPTLVVLGQTTGWRAFRLSLLGCIKNVLPLIWLNVIVAFFILVLVLPLLGLAWLVPSFKFGGYLIAIVVLLSLLPAMVVAMYGMSRDVFPALEHADISFD